MDRSFLPDRIVAKFQVCPGTGCWEWTACRDAAGYGKLWWDGNRKAHRVIYELLVGPIPEGLTLDHLCRVRHCVNPAHLEPATQTENTRRGTVPSVVASLVDRCVADAHELVGDNVGWQSGGKRYCRACKKASGHRRFQRVST